MARLQLQPHPVTFVSPAKAHGAIVHPWLNYGFAWARTFSIGAVISVLAVSSTFAAQLHAPSQLAPALAPTVRQSPAKPQVATPTPAPAPIVAPQPAAPDSAALQALLNKWQSDYASSQFGVVVQELGGQKRLASLQRDTSFQAASIYKMFLAQVIYIKVSQGQLDLDDTLGMPSTVGICVQRMVVVSDNTCGEGLASAIGWLAFNAKVHANGFNETSVLKANTTTANDVASFLEQLQNGTLLNQTDTQSLLGYMEQQIYRSAIPAGVPGVTVADKVGVIDNIWNDGAIVYHPKGTYVLVVLSTNSGPSPIKDLSHRISDFMNQ